MLRTGSLARSLWHCPTAHTCRRSAETRAAEIALNHPQDHRSMASHVQPSSPNCLRHPGAHTCRRSAEARAASEADAARASASEARWLSARSAAAQEAACALAAARPASSCRSSGAVASGSRSASSWSCVELGCLRKIGLVARMKIVAFGRFSRDCCTATASSTPGSRNFRGARRRWQRCLTCWRSHLARM